MSGMPAASAASAIGLLFSGVDVLLDDGHRIVLATRGEARVQLLLDQADDV
jgi:hypothetical protein